MNFKTIILTLLLITFVATINGQQIKPCSGKYRKEINGSFCNTPKELFALGNNQLYISCDNGLSWDKKKYIPINKTEVLSSICANDSVILVGTQIKDFDDEAHIYRSFDNGDNWQICGSGVFGSTTVNRIYLKNDTLFSCTGYGVFRSLNWGSSWQKCNSGLPSANKTFCMAGNDSILFVGGRYGVYYSKNGGQNWKPCKNGIAKESINQIVINNDDVYLLGKRIYHQKLPCNKVWIDITQGIQTTFINHLLCNDDKLYVSAFWQMYQKEGAHNWEIISLAVNKKIKNTDESIKGLPITSFIITDSTFVVSYSNKGAYLILDDND
nr:hypothetical protein [uncultured Carboxylicivirga sp.]